MTKKIDDLVDELVGLPQECQQTKVEELEKKIYSLQKTLETYGIIEEVHIDNIEYICQKGIEDLKAAAQNGILTQDDAKTLDILHKNLRMARGKLDKKEAPGRAASEAELLKIVKGDE